MVGAAGHDRLAHLVRRHAARPGLRGAQRRAGPRAARRPSSTTPAPPCAGCCPGTATWSRRCATRCWSGTSCIGDEITDVLEAATLRAGAAARARGERPDGRRRRCRGRGGRRGGAAAGGLAFGACPRVIPSTASPASSPRTSSVDGWPSARRRAGSRPGAARLDGQVLVARGRRRQAAVLHVRVRRRPARAPRAVRRVGLLRVAHAAGAGRRSRAGSMGAPRLRRAVRMGEDEREVRADGAAVALPARARRPGARAAGVRRDRRGPARPVGVRGARPGRARPRRSSGSGRTRRRPTTSPRPAT